ncbi:MAG: hypothetical protein UEP78_04815 [Negativibacillus sp.]|nr:hypothetical protein [Negativibacillus sp.]
MEQKPKVQENDYLPKRGNPMQETICYKIGGTVFEIETSCGGTEALYDKMVRLIRSETILPLFATCSTTSTLQPLYRNMWISGN